MTTSMDRSPLELDYLKVNANLRAFDASNGKHRRLITNFLSNAGLELSKDGGDWAFFENKDLGVKAFFSNFPMNDRKLAKRPTLSIEFTGHFFIRENAYESSRKMILFFVKKFGAFFNVSRVDIRQDIYDAEDPFSYFPDFTNPKNGLIWALRGQPEFKQHFENPTEKASAFSIQTSRYKIQSYNRVINIKKKFKKGAITEEYKDHYMDIYKDRQVQRLEVKILQDSCKVFAMLYFNSTYTKEKVLILTMANFARNHALKIYEYGKPIHKLRVNPVFAELFYYHEKEEVRYFKCDFEKKAGIKFSEVLFSERGRSFQEIVKMLTKKMCELSAGSTATFNDYRKKAVKLMYQLKSDFIDKPINRVERFEKSMTFMNLSPEELRDSYNVIHTKEYLEVYA